MHQDAAPASVYPATEVRLWLGGEWGAKVWRLLQGQFSHKNQLVLEQVLNAVYLNDSRAIPLQKNPELSCENVYGKNWFPL